MIEKFLNIKIKNNIQPYHWHDLMELNFVLKGEMDVVINNRKKHVQAGEIILLNRDDVHCIESTSGDLLYLQSLFNMETFNQYIPDIWNVYFECDPRDNDAVSQALKQEIKGYLADIFFLMNEKNTNSDYLSTVVLCCVEIISNLKLGFSINEKTYRGNVNPEQSALFWKIIDYMYDNCQRKLTLKEVADHVYLSESYLSKVMKMWVGNSYETYLGFIRAEKSLRYLLNTDMSITNIAYECGFSAPRYYKKTFEKTYNCTPEEYRRKNRSFFKMEKQSYVDYIMYDEGIDKADIFAKLEQYRWLSPKPKQNEEKLIEIDISRMPEKKTQKFRQIGNLACNAEDILNYDVMASLKDCRRDFEITEIYLSGDNKKILKIAENNLRLERFKVLTVSSEEVPVSMVKLGDLMTEQGIKRSAYYLQKALIKITERYDVLTENCIAFCQENTFCIVVYNEKDTAVDITLNVTGLEPGQDYLLCRFSSPKVAESMKAFIEERSYDNLNMSEDSMEKEIFKVYEPVPTFEIINQKTPIIKHAILGEKQMVLLKIQKINNN